jgi:hypothetical protein
METGKIFEEQEFWGSFIFYHSRIWITLSRLGVTRPTLIIHGGSQIYGQKVTRPNVIQGEHFESTVNKSMRLTKSSIHCEEMCPTNPVQSLSSIQ